MKLNGEYAYASNAQVWTINLKSFEIANEVPGCIYIKEWTINLKSFEIRDV